MGRVWMPGVPGGGGAKVDGVTATAYDVREGKKFVTADGNLVSGLQSDRGSWSTTLPINGSVTIPSGIHSGNGRVSQSVPVMQAQTITPTLNGTTVQTYQKYMAGNVKINPIPNQRVAGTKNNSCGVDDSGLFYYIPEGYYVPDSTGFSWVYASLPDVARALGITADKVKKGTILCGVTGTWEGYVAGVNDLYYNGVNAANFASKNCRFDSNQITCTRTGTGSSIDLTTGKQYNLTPYSRLIIDGMFHNKTSAYYEAKVYARNAPDDTNGQILLGKIDFREYTKNQFVLNFKQQITKYLYINIGVYSPSNENSYVTRIRLE